MTGYVYSEDRPQWGSLSAVCVFEKLPPAPRLDRAKMARFFYDTGMEFHRAKIPFGGNDYFAFAAAQAVAAQDHSTDCQAQDAGTSRRRGGDTAAVQCCGSPSA